jgi:L-iditol 2-dehydrogenase
MACALNSVETCRVTAGSTMAILGCGPMGLMHLVLGRAMGASKIIMSDPVPERRAMAEKLGATVAIDPATHSIAKETQARTGGLGADAGFLSIGIAELVEEGLGAVRKEGYFNLFAGFPPQARIDMEANRIHYDEIFMTGTQNATTDHYVRVSHMLPRLPGAQQLITNRYRPEEANLAYEARLGLTGLKAVVVYEGA